MAEHFPGIAKIEYEGPGSKNPLSFKHYNADEVVLGKTMEDHMRFSVCYWHTMQGLGQDMFGVNTMSRSFHIASDPIRAAEQTMEAAFEFFQKLGVKYWCFHDRDISPEAGSLADTNRNLDHIVDLADSLQNDTGIKTLWGTACLFVNPRYMAGAATNPSPEIFAYGAAQIKKAIEVTHRLNGEGYVFWGGREGYDTLLNTDMKQEADQLARMLHMAVDFKKSIGFEGQFYIEPKPQEPTKHQYDYDCQSCHAFLLEYGLENDFQLNIEANHATLSGHTFHHELEYAGARGLLGSVDANRGDYLIGWDTDQFPTDIYDTTMAMLTILKYGGFKAGGLNFDAKLRRQSTDLEDLFHAHIGGMDAFARGLKTAAKIMEDGVLEGKLTERYAGWSGDLGQSIITGRASLEDLEAHALESGEPEKSSGRQEMLENILNEYI
jgi:xylose isomerase